MLKKALFSILITALWINAFSQKANKTHPSFNKALTINVGTDSIVAYALVAEGSKQKETIVLLHGIPGYDKSFDLAQHLRLKRKNVIVFSYRGSWGSQGTYGYANCLEDIGVVIEHLSDSINRIELRIDTAKFVLIGHSLGGGLAMLYGSEDKRIKKIVAISALNFGYRLKRFSSVDSLTTFQKYVEAQFMLNCNVKEFVKEAYNHASKYDILTHLSTLKSKEILIIDDFDRSEDWPGEFNQWVKYKVIESDHSFTNKRRKLIRYISKWI